MKSLLAIFIVLGLFSCESNYVYEREINTVDSLLVVANNSYLRVDSIDVDKASIIMGDAEKMFDLLIDNYGDSTNRHFWIVQIPPLYDVKRDLNRFLSKRDNLLKDIKLSQKQLSTLKNSLQDEKLTKEEVVKYLDQELRAVQGISFLMAKYYPRAQKGLRNWSQVQEDLRPLLDSIQ